MQTTVFTLRMAVARRAPLRQQASRGFREIRENNPRPGPRDRGQRLDHGPIVIEPPFRAAATIIEYSPLIWYAAIGTSKRSRALAIRSRYGMAGLTMIMSAPS